MKYSEAMLKGYKKVNGKQCRGAMFKFDGGALVACCVMGAAELGGMENDKDRILAARKFAKAWGSGIHPVALNDIDDMPWEHIYGMAVAAGL